MALPSQRPRAVGATRDGEPLSLLLSILYYASLCPGSLAPTVLGSGRIPITLNGLGRCASTLPPTPLLLLRDPPYLVYCSNV